MIRVILLVGFVGLLFSLVNSTKTVNIFKNCNGSLNLSSIDGYDLVAEGDYSKSSVPSSCRIKIIPTTGRGVVVFVERVSLPMNIFPRCNIDNITLSSSDLYSDTICNVINKDETKFSRYPGPVNLNFIRSSRGTGSYSFSIVFTEYNTGLFSCKSGKYRCDNSRCIDSSLICNNRNNCGDDSDEYYCRRYRIGGIAGGVVGGLVLIGILVGVCCCYRRRTTTVIRTYQVPVASSQPVYVSGGYNDPPPAYPPGVYPSQEQLHYPGLQQLPYHNQQQLPYPTQPPAGIANPHYEAVHRKQ